MTASFLPEIMQSGHLCSLMMRNGELLVAVEQMVGRLCMRRADTFCASEEHPRRI